MKQLHIDAAVRVEKSKTVIKCSSSSCVHLCIIPLSESFLWQTYIKSMDKDFVAATIQAIGRCATNIGEVRDTCLNGLVQLLSNRDGKSVNVKRCS